jgi:hypothetical protein
VNLSVQQKFAAPITRGPHQGRGKYRASEVKPKRAMVGAVAHRQPPNGERNKQTEGWPEEEMVLGEVSAPPKSAMTEEDSRNNCRHGTTRREQQGIKPGRVEPGLPRLAGIIPDQRARKIADHRSHGQGDWEMSYPSMELGPKRCVHARWLIEVVPAYAEVSGESTTASVVVP